MGDAIFTVIPDRDSIENLKSLQEILDRLGVKVTLEKSDKMAGLTQLDLGYLRFSWDEVDLKEKVTRKAGRKSKFRTLEYRPEEIRQMIKNQGADAAARELGISRQYMYKRLKEAESENRYYF